jgi:hypothetical protein
MRGLALGLPAAPRRLVVPLLVPGEPSLELMRPLLLICRLASEVGALAAPGVALAPEPPLAAWATLLQASKSVCVAICAKAALPSTTSAVAGSIVAAVHVKLAITEFLLRSLRSPHGAPVGATGGRSSEMPPTQADRDRTAVLAA